MLKKTGKHHVAQSLTAMIVYYIPFSSMFYIYKVRENALEIVESCQV
jgi:hypothetical protein